MGFFSFFTKDKKEVLDQGLSKTKESVFGKIARAIVGKTQIDDDVLDNLEEKFANPCSTYKTKNQFHENCL